MALAAITCSSTLIPPTSLGSQPEPCSYPNACYVVQQSGPNMGQCADCTGGPEKCRLYFVPVQSYTGSPRDLGGVFITATADLATDDLAGLQLIPDFGAGGPSPSDQPIPCSLFWLGSDMLPGYDMGMVPWTGLLPPGTQVVCATAESLCIARGPKCTGGLCVRPNSVDGGNACNNPLATEPQRKPSTAETPGDNNSYCPLTDDVCCPPPAPDGGLLDGGTSDAKASDGGLSSDGGMRG
jgi:hypothetical protein